MTASVAYAQPSTPPSSIPPSSTPPSTPPSAPTPPRLLRGEPIEVDEARAPAAALVTIDERGAVTTAELVASTGDTTLDARVLEVVRRFVFAPAERDGRPIAARITVQVELVARARSDAATGAVVADDPADDADRDEAD